MRRKARHANYKIFTAFEGYLPGWKGIPVLLIWLLVGALAGSAVSLALTSVFGASLGVEYVTLVVYPIQFLPAMIYAASRSASVTTFPGARVLPLDRGCFKLVGGPACAVMAVVSVLCASLVLDPIVKVLPEMPERLKQALESMTGGDMWVDMLCVAVFAPFFEEWLCRGTVLRGLLSRGMKPAAAIGISALFFAVIHLNPWQAVPAFLIGCLMGFVYYRTGSLKLTMLMHCANNALAVVVSHIDAFKDAESWMDVMPGKWFWLVFAACALAVALFVRTMMRNGAPSWEAEVAED